MERGRPPSSRLSQDSGLPSLEQSSIEIHMQRLQEISERIANAKTPQEAQYWEDVEFGYQDNQLWKNIDPNHNS